MASRPSSISRLPPEIREAIGRLRDGGHTIDEILAHLAKMDIEVSRSALGRHVQRLERVGARLRRSREVAEALSRQLGEQQGDQVARLNIEVLHSFLADTMAAADDEDNEHRDEAQKALRNPMGARLFAQAIESLTKASRHNQDFVERIERRATEAAKREAAGAAEAAARGAGLNDDLIGKIKRAVLGLAT
jgi:hypothetical protein